MNKREFLRLLAAMPAAVSPLAFGQTASYPSRPIRIVSPFAAGSTSDTSARFIAHHLQLALNQPIVSQQLAVLRIEARLLEVEVGHQQRMLARPVQRAAGREAEFLTAKIERERNGNHALPLHRVRALGKGTARLDSHQCDEPSGGAIRGHPEEGTERCLTLA